MRGRAAELDYGLRLAAMDVIPLRRRASHSFFRPTGNLRPPYSSFGNLLEPIAGLTADDPAGATPDDRSR
jgi:hypothetical protein